MDTRSFPSISPKRLKTDILSTDTSFKLRDILWFTGSDGIDVNLTSAAFGTATVVAGVFEPGTAREEFFSFNPSTITLATTTGMTVVGRGLPKSSDYVTEATTRKFNHASGSVVLLFTNAQAFYDTFVNKNNDETITGDWTFTGTETFTDPNVPRLNVSHTYIAGQEEFFATKRYADSLAIAGAPNASTTTKGIVEEATDAENNAGTDTGATGARLFSVPSAIAKNSQNQQFQFQGTDTGAANAYIIAITPAPSGGLAAGQRYVFIAAFTNTLASTLQINALLAKDIRKYAQGALVALEAGDIQASQIIDVEYTGSLFLLQNPGGRTPTTAISNEMSTFFGSTDITGAEAETLTGSATSNADALHTHPGLLTSISFFRPFINGTAAPSAKFSGFSDATPKVFGTLFYEGGGANNVIVTGYHATSLGAGLFYFNDTNFVDTDTSSGIVYIGSDFWTANNDATAGNRIQKNGVNVTIVGTTPSVSPALGHDPTLSHLLVLDATTRIRRYSGIAGTTITFVSSVTLDTAVTVTGFLFDNTNTRFICLDKTSNVIRRFNSVGTTIDTVAYTENDADIVGLVMLNNRVYLAVCRGFRQTVTGSNVSGMTTDLIPTSMTR